MVDAVVKQLNDGVGTVFECSAIRKCIEANNAQNCIPNPKYVSSV
jgi:hypothetical protein